MPCEQPSAQLARREHINTAPRECGVSPGTTPHVYCLHDILPSLWYTDASYNAALKFEFTSIRDFLQSAMYASSISTPRISQGAEAARAAALQAEFNEKKWVWVPDDKDGYLAGWVAREEDEMGEVVMAAGGDVRYPYFL